MTQTTEIKDKIIDLVSEYISLTHQYKLTNSFVVWNKLSKVEEEIENLRVKLFKLDKISNLYLNKDIKYIFSRFN